MKVIASRADDLRREKEQYQSKLNSYNEGVNRLDAQFREDFDQYASPIQSMIEELFAPENLLDAHVNVTWRYGSSVYIDIKVNPRNSAAALQWSYSVTINPDGAVSIETRSMSGMNASTPENISELKQMVRVLEQLNEINWAALIADKPSEPDYSTLEFPENYKNFDLQIKVAEIVDSIGTNTLLAGYGDGTYYNNSALMYYKVVRQTAKMYEVIAVTKRDLDRAASIEEVVSHGYQFKMTKDKFNQILIDPVEKITY